MVPVTELVDRMRGLCKSQKTSLTKLEEEFGWANGTIGKWGKRSNKYPPHDKLLLIANALGVSVSYLTGESEQKEKPTVKDDGPSAEDIKLLLSKMSVTDLQSLMGEIAAEMAGRAKQ